MQTPLEADPLVMRPVMHAGKPPPGQTNTCENIMLPQTSFAGGKNVKIRPKCKLRLTGKFRPR